MAIYYRSSLNRAEIRIEDVDEIDPEVPFLCIQIRNADGSMSDKSYLSPEAAEDLLGKLVKYLEWYGD